MTVKRSCPRDEFRKPVGGADEPDNTFAKLKKTYMCLRRESRGCACRAACGLRCAWRWSRLRPLSRRPSQAAMLGFATLTVRSRHPLTVEQACPGAPLKISGQFNSLATRSRHACMHRARSRCGCACIWVGLRERALGRAQRSIIQSSMRRFGTMEAVNTSLLAVDCWKCATQSALHTMCVCSEILGDVHGGAFDAFIPCPHLSLTARRACATMRV